MIVTKQRYIDFIIIIVIIIIIIIVQFSVALKHVVH